MITSLPADTRIRDAADATKAAQVGPREQTPTGNVLQVQIGPGDVISNLPVVIDFSHHQIHEGETWRAIDQQLSLGTGTVKYAFVAGAYNPSVRAPHLVVGADVFDGTVRVDIYAGATYTSGSTLTARNRNRNIVGSPGSTAYTGVTSTNGTLIESFFCDAGKGAAGGSRTESEWILKPSTTYRVDIVGLAANTQAVVRFDWYEDLGV